MNWWSNVFKQATEEQIDSREIDCNFVDCGYQSRRIYFDES